LSEKLGKRRIIAATLMFIGVVAIAISS